MRPRCIHVSKLTKTLVYACNVFGSLFFEAFRPTVCI